MRCLFCGGPLVRLGRLGKQTWYRCRDCGSERYVTEGEEKP